MSAPVQVLQVLDPGLGASFQDLGRFGWRRFGVPPGGAMDDHAAGFANRLLDNAANEPVIEFLLQGLKLAVLEDVWLAFCGAAVEGAFPSWTAYHARKHEALHFRENKGGVWGYLAVEGGFAAPTPLGSASVLARGRLGEPLKKGDLLCRKGRAPFALPDAVPGRSVGFGERRDHAHPPKLRLWRGPQWELFSEEDRISLVSQSWEISPLSDRIGYRLKGKPCGSGLAEMLSEPVRVGSLQVPENGLPIVTMRDGPTVGGYPKIAMVDPADVSWLAQRRPGQSVSFEFVNEV